MSLKAKPEAAPKGKAGRPRKVPANRTDLEAEEQMDWELEQLDSWQSSIYVRWHISIGTFFIDLCQ